MRIFISFFLFVSVHWADAQDFHNPIPSRIKESFDVPADLLAKRTCVFYSSDMKIDQLEKIQKSFQNSGIDAVAYFKTELVFAGREVTQKITEFLNKREIAFIALISRDNKGFSFLITPFNGNPTFVDEGQKAWAVNFPDLSEALQIIYRTAINNQPNKNLLINSYPETNFPISVIDGRRSDFFAIDLKVDHLAVPWFQNAESDSLLVKLFKDYYPFTYAMTEPGQDKKELRSKGFHYELCLVHTEGAIAREILGYPASGESAITSVTYPNGDVRLKTIPSETPVYKFYFKHLESGNVFLGTKWDADVTWDSALRNHIKGFRAELKIP